MGDETVEVVVANCRLLLKEAALLYLQHEAGRSQPFNVFSVLRSGSDEVNLHSRFLHALLDYRRAAEGDRENLADFLRHVGVEDFESRGTRVERESDNIDILITNDARQAVVVENKIWSGDQPEQLQRYHDTLKRRGYAEIHLLYLTPYGDNPSEDSAGSLPYEAISYRHTLPLWLERCQQRAYDEPGLRESIAQYRRLIRNLTGTDFEESYVNALTQLVLRDNNLLLVNDLKNEGYAGAMANLLQNMWREVDDALRAELGEDGLPPVDKNHENHASKSRVTHFLTGTRNRYHGLFYPFGGGAALAVEAGSSDGLILGVHCYKKDNQQLHERLRNELEQVQGGIISDYWPWYKVVGGLNLKNPTRNDLMLLLSEADRGAYATAIAQDLAPIWRRLKRLNT